MFNLPYWIDLTGVLFFALSGAQAACDRRMHRDFFGVAFMGFVTAIGGGSLRDIMLGIHPLAWIHDANYLIVIGAGVLISVIFEKFLSRQKRIMLYFDSIGIAIYTIIGVEISLHAGVNPLAAIVLGMFSAVFGGVIRDTLLNEVPLIFRKEIYATACLAGATSFVTFRLLLPQEINVLLGVAIIIAIRLLAVRNNWSLPKIGK
jgi:uncharacterized membrane protein YeiH